MALPARESDRFSIVMAACNAVYNASADKRIRSFEGILGLFGWLRDLSDTDDVLGEMLP